MPAQPPIPSLLTHASWGRVPAAKQRLYTLRANEAPTEVPKPWLGYGLGRSYGDSCLNSAGSLIGSRAMDAVIFFDRENGILRAEAGVTLRTVLSLCLTPLSDGTHWYLPTSPGTAFVTLAGAVANDVHGKNHHARGSFGCHLRAFTLLRGDGTKLECSRENHADLFFATIGGLGLTGLILEVEIQMLRVPGLGLEVETQRFDHLDRFTGLSAESRDWEYSVAWVDCLAPAAQLGRGLFSRARHVPAPAPRKLSAPKISVPLTLPFCPLNGLTLRAFNGLYLRQVRRPGWVRSRPDFMGYFYPLDAIGAWNRMYGPRGFYQYQCVLPPLAAQAGIRALLECIRISGQGSFLAVLKSFGALRSGGLLSFPMEGQTLALDFPNKGAATLALFEHLDAITLAHGGRIYPAKDGRVPVATFRRMMPELESLAPFVDPAFTSDFWRRMDGAAQRPTPLESTPS